MKIRFIAFLLAGILLGLPLISGCKGEDKKAEIRLGYLTNVTHAVPMVGMNQKIFSKELGEKVSTNTKTFIGGPALMEALIAGEIDVAYVGPGPAINSFVKGAPIRIIAGSNNGGSVLVAGKNSGVKNVKDLNKKTVATPQFASTQDVFLRGLLKAKGLQDKAKGGTVNIIQVAPADMYLLFKQKQLDAALLPEPWGTQLKQQGVVDFVLDWDEIWNKGDYPTVVLIVSDQFASQHPELVEKWLKAHMSTVQYINNNPVKSREIIKNRLKVLTRQDLEIDTIKAAMDRSKTTYLINQNILQEFAKLTYEAGYLKQKPDVNKLYDDSFLKKVK